MTLLPLNSSRLMCYFPNACILQICTINDKNPFVSTKRLKNFVSEKMATSYVRFGWLKEGDRREQLKK